MVIFISGASGYLGSNLVKTLSKDYTVVSLIRSSSSTERIRNIDTDLVYTDSPTVLENAFKKYQPDIVINTAALYGRNNESLSSLVIANVDFPTKLLQLAEQYNSKAFIHTGTSLPDDVSPYALTKNTFVKLTKFNAKRHVKFINIALEHFYGPDDDNGKFTSYVINACVTGEKLQLTQGTQRRDFVYIDDVVSAYKVLIQNLINLRDQETIPVGSGVAPTIRELVEVIHSCSNSKSELEFGAVAMRENELMYSCANLTRLIQFDWKPKYSLESGIYAILQGKK
ncbi:hypothetical protein BCT06_13770 [Vibrio breoganii]|uniref:NAD-dependent epimerase/dehydratase family protein n=1 Tax=Vibrio breoganii TaxID=553239 RepID=UPI000C827B08|nr:NAD-dependent epimerase/dehydratase family protein [Vibrio breoganii]PML13659.1 hypothetical protein BCT84_13065 [Vibrio breoganii]PMO59973.1 hypothetical protein BCT06_13770 [Vibrio breoganii]